MNDDAIYDGFATLLSTFAAGRSPALPVLFPGIGAKPPASGFWLELRWIPNEPANYGTANDAPTLLQGLAQVNVCYRPGQGIVDGLELAGAVIAAFPKGTVIAERVRITRRPWVAGAIEDPERVMHPVTIPWQGFNA